MAPDREYETFQRELPRLLEEGHEGEFALVCGDRVDSLWPTDEAAYEAGCARFGLEPFIVQQIQRVEQPERLLIDINPPCPS